MPAETPTVRPPVTVHVEPLLCESAVDAWKETETVCGQVPGPVSHDCGSVTMRCWPVVTPIFLGSPTIVHAGVEGSTGVGVGVEGGAGMSEGSGGVETAGGSGVNQSLILFHRPRRALMV